MAESPDTSFNLLSDDILINIFLKLEVDPRNWARLACVSTRFSFIIINVCYRAKCNRSIPAVVSDLLSCRHATGDAPPGGWAALYKLSVCCPGLLHTGVLLENSDFGLELELGSDESYRRVRARPLHPLLPPVTAPSTNPTDCIWSLYDDLFFDTMYVSSEPLPSNSVASATEEVRDLPREKRKKMKKRKGEDEVCASHLASGCAWNLSREQGHKLLASRFRSDTLYICNWPGCVHAEAKRKYMLFRGVFKDFKGSCVWRSIKDGKRKKILIGCAFCSCREVWDLYSAFCLRRVFGYHEDGDPEVRAYVCENGHVSGAWTERPMYS
ncbi:F-box family protein [Wolffia australiana]